MGLTYTDIFCGAGGLLGRLRRRHHLTDTGSRSSRSSRVSRFRGLCGFCGVLRLLWVNRGGSDHSATLWLALTLG